MPIRHWSTDAKATARRRFAGSLEVAGFLLDHATKIDALDIDHESTPAQYLAG